MAGQAVQPSQRVNTNTKQVISPSNQISATRPSFIPPPKSKKSKATNPNRYRHFHEFSKIPPEIRLKIWRYTMRLRVIRAEYQNMTTDVIHQDVRVALINLDAGPVPSVLHVNVESRTEALRYYSSLKAKLPINALTRDGERLPPGDEPPKQPSWLENRIWINPSVDILFFVNFPSTVEFLNYFRRISKPAVGGLPIDRPIQNIALVGKDMQRLRTSGRTGLFYLLCMEHKQVSSIGIVLDNSNFRSAVKPESYSLWNVDPLPESSGRGGGLHGGRELRQHCEDIFREFWPGKKTVKDWEKWVLWRSKNREWVPPRVRFRRIARMKKAGPVKKPRAKKVEVVEIEDDEEEDESEEEQNGEGSKQK